MSSKSPAFQWYAADYLADERVAQLSLDSEAVYVRLLSYCWREGSIPAKPEQCAPMCKYADIKVIKPALSLFIKSPSQAGRLIHKRLEEERAKQEEYRAKQSAKGKAGGRPKKEEVSEKPKKATALPQLSPGLTEGDLSESSSSSTSTSTKVDEESEASAPKEEQEVQPLKADKPKRTLPPPPEDAPLFTADNWPGLVNPATFAAICTDLRLPIDLDRETYRAAIQDKMRGMKLEAPATTLRSWISSYFVNEKKKGPLLSLTVGLPTVPTPRHELPQKGQERPGQIIAIEGVPHDANMNRMKVASYQSMWPTAQIHAILPRQN